IRYRLDHHFTYWNVHSHFFSNIVAAGLSILFHPKIRLALQYQRGDLAFRELSTDTRTRRDKDRRYTLSLMKRFKGKTRLVFTYIYYKKSSTEFIFNQDYNCIGGEFRYEF
ncbi:MAG: hypothetical protein GY940_24680, partial [bacterium]|nr:hypothetical protein [bacterium]